MPNAAAASNSVGSSSPLGSPVGDLFQKGLAAYQNKQYAEARDDFQKLLDQGKQSPGLLNNLALSVYQLDQKPLALALWRRALSLRPGFPPAILGRDLLESKMQMRPLEHDSLSLWTHRTLENLSLFELLWINGLFLAFGGWLGIRFFGARRAAMEEDLALPRFPALLAPSLLLLVVSLSLVVLKAKDTFTARATVVSPKTSARSLPADDSVGLFDLSGGTEVLTLAEQNGWTQVRNADSSSGWVKNSEIFITSLHGR